MNLTRSFHFLLSAITVSIWATVGAAQSEGSNSAFAPRLNFSALLEPDDVVLHGAGQDPGPGHPPTGFAEYAEAIGPDQAPAMFMTYIGFSHSPEHILEWGRDLDAKLNSTRGPDLIPQIGLALTGGNDTGTGLDGEIAAGKRDDQIAAFVQALKRLGRPAYVRIGYECEGSWNGYTPGTYVATFQRITKAIRAANLPVATVWCVAGGSSGTTELAPLMPYYPGDEWVDWWSIDIFSVEEIDAPLVAEFCRASGARNKPVMIGEATPRYVGVLEGQTNWDQWFGPYFAMIRRHPEIKASSYINWEWDYWASTLGFEWVAWGDARIDQNPVVLKKMRAEMSSPLYRHASKR